MLSSYKENETIIFDWIKSKCGQMRCTCCGDGKWTILPNSYLQIGYDLDTTRFYFHQGIPLVSIVCENCAHIVQFSPLIMGIQPKPVEEESIETT